MSSKKEYTSIGMDGELLRLIRKEAKHKERSLGWVVEEMAKAYFHVAETGRGVALNAD